MASGLRWRINRANLVGRDVRRAAAAGLAEGVEFLGGEANRTVPIEEATLERSMVPSVNFPRGGGQGRLRGAVSYDTPYAARQHEELEYQHDEGRRAKWLERTFQEQGKTAVEHVAAPIRALLK